MMFGHVETLAERIEHLERLRQLQDETGGFTAFICWTFQPEHTDMADVPPAGSFEYLKTKAVARLYLDNFPNIQSSWVTQGLKIGQLALLYGANDMGSLMIEENVVAEAGTVHHLSLDQIRGAIEELGYAPRQRPARRAAAPPPAWRLMELPSASASATSAFERRVSGTASTSPRPATARRTCCATGERPRRSERRPRRSACACVFASPKLAQPGEQHRRRDGHPDGDALQQRPDGDLETKHRLHPALQLVRAGPQDGTRTSERVRVHRFGMGAGVG